MGGFLSNPDGGANITSSVFARLETEVYSCSKQIVTEVCSLAKIPCCNDPHVAFYALLAIPFHSPMPAVLRCNHR